MCLNKSKMVQFFNIINSFNTTPARPIKDCKSNIRQKEDKNDLKSEGQCKRFGLCNSKDNKRRYSELNNVSPCQQSTGASCSKEIETRENANSKNDIRDDLGTFKDIHEEKKSKDETKEEIKHDRNKTIEDAVQKVTDGIKELKEILIKIKKTIGYPEDTKREKKTKYKQSKRTKRKVQRKPQYYRTKTEKNDGKLIKKRKNENRSKRLIDKLLIVPNDIKKKQKSTGYFIQRYLYLQMILQTWLISPRKSPSKKRTNKLPFALPHDIRSSIFRFRNRNRGGLVNVYPIHRNSINDYFKNLNLENENTNTRHPMSYEWFRFGSFARYPENAPVRPIRLSAAGFHATGNGDEVKCFSCGVTYRNWLAEDDAMNVHRRISPHCAFVCSFDSNIPVRHPQGDEAENSIVHGDAVTTQNSSENNIENTTYRQRERHPSETQANFQQNSSLSGNELEQRNERGNGLCTNELEHGVDHPQPTVLNNHSQVPLVVVERLDPLGINFQKPKFPAYAILEKRIRTYENWPENVTQKPKDMALAGFLYIGELDYCRCFFCGGGLRHWEDGDDPWVEHARWFPKCYFLRQNKGDLFVTRIQQAEKKAKESDAGPGAACINNNSTGTAAEAQCTYNTKGNKTNDHYAVNAMSLDTQTTDANLSDDIFNLPSTLSVLEMGYTKEQVKQAITVFRKVQHGKPFTGSDILTTLFAIENGEIDKENNETAEEDEVLKENRRLKEQKLCKICKAEDANIAFLPCGHLICCGDCAPAMRNCPSCHEYVRGTVKTWLV